MRLIVRRWKVPKIIWGLFILELPVTVAVLALFAIADPDLYRTRLWEDGYRNGFNSNPTEVLYAEVNGRPISTPLVWSQFVTDYNVIISVLSTFILLVKAVLFALHIFIPLLSVLVHGLLAGLFGYSIYCQSAPDLSDPRHPRNGPPWYVYTNCNDSYYHKNINYCKQAKSAWAVTIVILGLFSINTLVALWSAFPTRDERRARASTVEEADDDDSDGVTQRAPGKSQNRWEMQQFPAQPADAGRPAPTPRTLAFSRLGGGARSGSGDLPLRDGR